MQALAIQQALLAQGYDLGPAKADGIWGRVSMTALKQFQVESGLIASGVTDEATLKLLFGARTASPVPTPLWFEEASRLKGLHETAGEASNPTITGWARTLGGWVAKVYRDDATPWCGLFVAHCIGLTLPEEPLPGNPLSALAWMKFGKPAVRPAPGTICVFTRKGGGHVGFYVGEDADAIHVLGGNQSDAVTVARVSRFRLSGMRWPLTTPPPATGRVTVSAIGGLSRDEA